MGPVDRSTEIGLRPKLRVVVEVRADALQALSFDDGLRLASIAEALELRIARRAQLNLADAGVVHVLEDGSKLALCDSRTHGIGLAANREAQRIGEDRSGLEDGQP